MIRTKAQRTLAQSQLPPEPLALAAEIGTLTRELDAAMAQLRVAERSLDRIRKIIA